MSNLTPLQINVTAGLLHNQGLVPSQDFVAVISSYASQTPVGLLTNTINAVNNSLTTSTVNQLKTLASGICPALSDSIPSANAVDYPVESMSELLKNTAIAYLGAGDVTKFLQAVSQAGIYCDTTNSVINSSTNSQDYLANTFTDMNSMITGGISDVASDTTALAQDLANLGSLIDLSNLNELGTPLALIQQLAKLGGVTPEISLAFTAYGVSLDTVLKLTEPNSTAGISEQKAMYAAMLSITGDMLTPILTIFGVTTANITSMADLLNPAKIFPNSFQTLTMIGVDNVKQNIYKDSGGTVNTNLTLVMPDVTLKTLV